MKGYWRIIALAGMGWCILMPIFLFWQESNDSELRRLQKLAGDMSFSDKPYNAAGSNDSVSVTKYSLERNRGEIGSLVDLHRQRFTEFMIAVLVSSATIMALSFHIFRYSKR
jgi:hypothetical protein